MLILQITCVIPSHGSLLPHSVTGLSHGNYGMASPVLVTIPSGMLHENSQCIPIAASDKYYSLMVLSRLFEICCGVICSNINICFIYAHMAIGSNIPRLAQRCCSIVFLWTTSVCTSFCYQTLVGQFLLKSFSRSVVLLLNANSLVALQDQNCMWPSFPKETNK